MRSQWVDIAKGFAILAVVLFHINYNFPDSKLLPVTALFGYAWHVPVFFLIGGFFIKEERLVQPVGFIKGKIKSLYQLLLYFYIPAVCLHNMLLDIGWYDTATDYGGKSMSYWSVTQTLKELLLAVCLAGREPILGAMWFVYVLFMALCGFSIISWMVKKAFKDEQQYEWVRLIILLGLCMLSCTASRLFDFTIPRFSNVITAMWLIYCGCKLKNQFHWSFTNPYICCLSAMILYHSATLWGGVSLNGNNYRDTMILTTTSVSAMYVICFFSKKLEGRWAGAFLSQCGKDSFYIMGLHFIGFKVCTLFLNGLGFNEKLSALTAPAGNSIGLLLAYLTFGMLFPLAFMWAFRKVKATIIQRNR